MSYHPEALDRRDPKLIAQILPVLERFNASYFRLAVEGCEHVPATPCLVVGNHNGGILGPDLFCTLAVLWRKLAPAHPLYALAHDFAMRQFPSLGRALQKVGAVTASKANAARVLQTGGHLLVYPGGDRDAYRTWRRRNHVVISPRCGFVKVAQAHNVPIVPVVAAGAHRSAYIFGDGEWIARSLQMKSWARLERFPLALALPWGLAPGPWLPYLPLPFQVRLKFLPPILVDPSDNPAEVARAIEATMQQTLTAMVQR